jgi:hypothetical protein
MASWSPGDQLDWWVKERQEWWDRVRGAKTVRAQYQLLSSTARTFSKMGFSSVYYLRSVSEIDASVVQTIRD